MNPSDDTLSQILRPDAAPPNVNSMEPTARLVEKAPTKWSWVPVRSLAPRHRIRIVAHLLKLDSHDRYLRFGYPATDAQISKYVDMVDFDHDEVFGIFNRRLELVALAHLAHPSKDADPQRPAMSEFGVSVLAESRGRGFGARLFEHAMLHARNRGVQTLFIHALSENTAMLNIARSAGATVERSGSESEAWLKLPSDTLASHAEEVVVEQAAEIDYRLKLHARQVSEILGTLSEVKTHISKAVSMLDD